jgi:hypothetical protein
MIGYPTLTDIELRWRAAGSGICVIVEGQTEQDDAWFYSRWFGDRAREMTFFPQDGWEHVMDAVADLRLRLGNKAVYGIIDRDFEAILTHDPFPASGVLRTPKYTLENYLLDPGCWFKCVQPYTLRSPRIGWSTPVEVEATIAGLYQQCLPLSAFNWTLRQARKGAPAAFSALPEKERIYREHPAALANLADVSRYFDELRGKLGTTADLGRLYRERLAQLHQLTSVQLQEVVSGKYVHKLMAERFPLKLTGKQGWDDLLSAYLYHCPEPPADLAALITLIAQDARS